MKILSIADRAEVSGTRRTADGYLVAECRAARGDNIQIYFGREIGDDDASREFRVYRPADEVFKADSLRTYGNKPITVNHPAEGVTAENWRDTAVGHIGSEVIRDGEFVKIPMMISDAAAIAHVEGGTRELSMGYDCELVMEAGTTADGRAYDAYQRNIRINHLAIVPAGRAGPQCRIGDQSRVRIEQPQKKDAVPMTKSVTIDGKTFEVADEIAAALAAKDAAAIAEKQAIEKKVTDTTSAAADVLTQAQKAIADLKAQIPTADQVGKMASELADARIAAKSIAPDLDTSALFTADAVKSAAAKAVLGDAAKDRSADYLSAAFDMLLARKNDADPVAKAIATVADVSTNDAGDKAFNAYKAEQANAWKARPAH